MHAVTLPVIGTDAAWRDAARCALAARIPPERIDWHHGSSDGGLFEGAPLPPATATLKVPGSFVALANSVVWHSDPQRFARLYALLWRLRAERGLMSDRADPDLARLRQMEKAVHRCQHKMKAFVRFRDLREPGLNPATGAPDPARRSFGAWFEPTHFTLEPTAPFFARRFGDMDWTILTPDLTARFTGGTLTFHKGAARPDLPDDATEELWGTYFQNIFNPARVKIAAMTSEMPRKYWKNMPETRHIPDMLATAEARVRAMQDAAPTRPPVRAAGITERYRDHMPAPHVSTGMDTLADLRADLNGCTRCPLHRDATQAVPGEGPVDAPLMIVGEQPGDTEDLTGRPYIGPAGQLFDRIAAGAGIVREAAYVTNAVKHFKFAPRGKRRIHQNPNTSEIAHCKWWLDAEIGLLKPRLILSMGGTAAESLTGTRKGILKRRGTLEAAGDGTPVFLTVHPSYILRLPDADLRAAEEARFGADLAAAQAALEELLAA